MTTLLLNNNIILNFRITQKKALKLLNYYFLIRIVSYFDFNLSFALGF